MESFFSLLKTEFGHHCGWGAREETRRKIAEHIEMLYFRQRWQAQLDYLSLADHKSHFNKKLFAT